MAVTDGALLGGRYRIIERLGSGGMAAVYLAEDERLGRRVAVKRLHAESPEDVARRFQREARLGASLNHPNIVSIYDSAADQHGVLIVMEYVEGPTLGEALSQGGLAVPDALEVLKGVAAALDQAHSQGVVHRDVKPANVLLGQSGTAKLADLGIATATEGEQITRTGALLGTPAYMAPEQLEGEAVGPAVDVYSLAAVAFEALGGRKARVGRTPVEIAHRATTEPPPDLVEVWPDAPAGAAEVLSRGMARHPAERPASAGELVAELTDALDGSAEGGSELEDERRRGARLLASAAASAAALGGRVAGRGAPDPVTAHDPTEMRARSTPDPTRLAPGGAAARTSRRPGGSTLATVFAVLLLAGAAVAVAITAGGGPEPTRRAASPPPVPSPPPPPEFRPPSVRTPAGSVRQFYARAAADRFESAWSLVGPGGRAQFGGDLGTFENTFETLQRVDFSRVKVADRSGDQASVEIRSVASHTDRTDNCNGSIAVSRGAGGRWLIERFGVSCQKFAPGGGDEGGGSSAGGPSASSGASRGAVKGSKVGKALKAGKKDG